ncbi:tRNA dimethylallyltransferase [Phycisphaerales bacterium]|nr:tRNA dimethylallyltransferase [Phycisphaerales bacterium]
MPRFPIIAGPTAGGKTGLAIEVALALRALGTPAEVITADAFQVYRGMDIGTAKPTFVEQRGVPHHLLDIVEPTERFTVNDWLAAANAAIADIQARGHVPIVVGGTHLYIKSLLDGLFEGPGADPALREQLRAMGRETLLAELQRVDPAAAARIHPNDERRTIRALEVFRLTGKPITEHQTQWDMPRASCLVPKASCLITLSWPTEELNRRINARVKSMIDRGLASEARALWQSNLLGPQAREALGYKQLIEHFEGRATLDETIERIKIETRRFGKNQRTWLRRLSTTPGSTSIEAGETSPATWSPLVLAAMDCPTEPGA